MTANFIKFTAQTTLFQAVESFHNAEILFAVVVNDKDQLIGSVEMRQLHMALMEGRDIHASITTVMNSKPVVAFTDADIEKVAGEENRYIPLLDSGNRVKSVHAVQRRGKSGSVPGSKTLAQLIVQPGATIKKAVKILDTTGMNIVLVVSQENKFLGLVTARDIRDSILEGHDADTPVEKIMNKNPVTGLQGLTKKELLRLVDSKLQLSKLKVPLSGVEIKVPILDAGNRLKGLAVNDELNPDTTLFFVGDDEIPFKDKVKSVLITGGAGYIGSILTRRLLRKGYKVRVLDSLLYGDGPIREVYGHPQFELIKGDIRHIEDVGRAVRGIDAVIHLAAIVGDPACALDSKFTIESNYLATKLLASICKHHQINRFIFSSTCSVYGASPEKLSETSELNPVSLYARSKIYSEKAILEIMDENFSPAILRLGTIYGVSPRPRFDLVLNIFVAKAIRDGKIQVQGGGQYRPMVHVGDAAAGFVACLEAPIEKVRGEIFNVGSNEQNLRIQELAEAVIRHVPGAQMEVAASKTDNRDYWVYFDKIKNNLSYKPEVSIDEGIGELIDFFAKEEGLNYQDTQYSNVQILSNQLEH